MKKKIFKIIITLLLTFMITMFLAHSIFYLFFFKEYIANNKRKIIDKYENNELGFERSVKELYKEKDDIYFEREGPLIIIEIFKDNPSPKKGVIIKKVKITDYYKYKNTLKLMLKLKIKKIDKQDVNVNFLFETPYGRGQYIIDLNNEEKFKSSYDVVELENIKNNWTYAEVD